VRALTGREPTVAAIADVPYLHPGVGAQLVLDGVPVGLVGELHPDVRARFGIDAPVYLAEVALDRFTEPGPTHMRPVPRFPASARDISLLLPDAVPASQVEAAIAQVAEPLVERVALAEEYKDAAKLGAGAKSQLWSITYRASDRTLTDAEIERAHEGIVAALTAALPAQRR
jgi:phenylalanyl-tRNA synthetase beta chain